MPRKRSSNKKSLSLWVTEEMKDKIDNLVVMENERLEGRYEVNRTDVVTFLLKEAVTRYEAEIAERKKGQNDEG